MAEAVAYPWLLLRQMGNAAAACYQPAMLHKTQSVFTLPAHMTSRTVLKLRQAPCS